MTLRRKTPIEGKAASRLYVPEFFALERRAGVRIGRAYSASRHLVEREGHRQYTVSRRKGRHFVLWHVTRKSMVLRNDGCCVKSMRMVILNGQPY